MDDDELDRSSRYGVGDDGKGRTKDEDSRQEGDSSGDLMGLKEGKGKQGKGQHKDAATSVDSGKTRRRTVARQQQCAATVCSGDTWESRAVRRVKESKKGREQGRAQGDNDMTMTHSKKSRIHRMKAWPYRQECRDHGPTKKNLFYW